MGSGAQAVSYFMAVRASYPEIKVAGTWSYLITGIYSRSEDGVMFYLHPACLYGAVPNQKQGLLYILVHEIIWAEQKCDEAVEIAKCVYIYRLS